MTSPNLTTLHLYLDDLFARRRDDLMASATGTVYAVPLQQYQRDILALPAALRGRTAVLPLGALDDRHDALRDSIDAVISGHLTSPMTSEDLRAALIKSSKRLDEQLPSRRASYAQEISAAKLLEPELPSHQATLSQIPVAGGTLFDWLTELVASAKAMEAFLLERADEVSASDRSNASRLRTQCAALLRRFRAALRDELHARPELPRDLEQRLFGYLDELVTAQGKASTKQHEPAG